MGLVPPISHGFLNLNSLSSIELTFGRAQEERFVIERLYRRTATEPINGREPDLSGICNVTATASERYLNGKPRGFSSLVKSYAEDLRSWATGRATGYGIAIALMLIGILSIFAAIAIGAMALFHFLELRYGTYIACAALGGGIVLLAVIFLLAGYQMLRRPSPVPKPERQLRAARQNAAGNVGRAR